MSSPPPNRSAQATAELRKLAHALDVEPDRLNSVAGLPADDIRTLRKQVGEALFQADKHYFARVAALSKAIPGSVAAKLTEVVLPPLIAARTAELLEPRRAADLVGRISAKYLADVSLYMDASRAPEVIAAIPTARIASVGAELARRKEWVVIGGFVAQVSQEALAASVAQFDGEQLLRIGFVLDDVTRLDDIGTMLTDVQIDEMLAAAGEFGLWTEIQELCEHLAPERIARMAGRYAVADKSVQAPFEAAAKSGDLAKATLQRFTTG
jgi:hypothetical protein